LSRIAKDSPEGPAPTTMTSYSIVSRSLMGAPSFWLVAIWRGLGRVARYSGAGPDGILRIRLLRGKQVPACGWFARAEHNDVGFVPECA
jgi:hypothetical protein